MTRRLNRLHKILLFAVLPALLLAGGWVWMQPHGYRKVAEFPGLYSGFTPCTTGFRLTTWPDTFEFRDWHTGALRWKLTRKHTLSAISPNGDYLAAVTSDPTRQVLLWHGGKPSSAVTIPLSDARWQNNGLTVTNTGRVFLSHYKEQRQDVPQYLVTAIEKSRIIARGVFPGLMDMTNDGTLATFFKMPDSFIVARLTLNKGRITTQPIPDCRSMYETDCLYPYPMNGAFIDLDGTVFTVQGKRPSPVAGQYMSPNWRYLQPCTTHFALNNFTKKDEITAACILNTQTGAYWQFHLPAHHSMWFPVASGNGRYCLAKVSDERSQVLNDLLDWLPQQLHLPYALRYSSEILLYNSRGAIHARLRLPGGMAETSHGKMDVERAYPSPDGQSMVISTRKSHESRGPYLLYRQTFR